MRLTYLYTRGNRYLILKLYYKYIKQVNYKWEFLMPSYNKTDETTKMARRDINQDGLSEEDQQRTDECALDMMQGLHEHEDHEEEDDE